MGSIPDLGPDHSPVFDQVPTRFNPDPESKYRISSRRNSNVPAFSNSPRAASPEQTRRAYSPVSTFRNGAPTGAISSASSLRNGGMSPVSTLRNEGIMMRSASPLRSEINGPMSAARNSSPASNMRNPRAESPANTHTMRNGNPLAQQVQTNQAKQAHENALAALQGETPQAAPPSPKKHLSAAHKSKQRLSLVTQVPAPQTVPEEDEEEEEVISMSPVVKTPIVSYRRSRSSLALSGLPNGSSSNLHLSGLNLTSRENDRPYFGQAVNHTDLVATGIENAFDRL